jgi:hypothetical protein
MKYTHELDLGKMMSEIFFSLFVELLFSNDELSLVSFCSDCIDLSLYLNSFDLINLTIEHEMSSCS